MGPGYEIQTFERTGLLGRRWYFRVVDTGNWETILTSEAYRRPANRFATMDPLHKSTGWPIIPERRKK